MDFFCESNGHLHIRSAPTFSLRDPTLAFVNAGMNQFKDVFLGLVHPASKRVANYQKCIRIGGKHNDLTQVGQDGTHHTFFEMLGNWSFGDYFKAEACKMSWDLLTKSLNLPTERLYVTYFGGDESLGLEADTEVRDIWRSLGVKDSHVLAFGALENFWEASSTGPCGLCTEIHFDHRPGRKEAGALVNAGSSELTELWNLVFIQYNRYNDGTLGKLATHFVDTGMGFERLVAVLQGKTSNYDTDLFIPLFKAIQTHSGHSGYTGKYDGHVVDSGYRILADHSRMITVALSDGMIPNQQSKVRGIIRKALRVSEKVFKADSQLLKELSYRVAETLDDAYPEIGRTLSKVQHAIAVEEELMKSQKAQAESQWKNLIEEIPQAKGLETIDCPQLVEGMKYLKSNVLDKRKTEIDGEAAWILYDTLGIPLDVTEQTAAKLGLRFSFSSAENFMADMKQQMKVAFDQKSKQNLVVSPEILSQLEKAGVAPTTDYFKYDYRVNGAGEYLLKNQPSTIEGIILEEKLVDQVSAEEVEGREDVGLILDRTQLYSEESNQASDSGCFLIENEVKFRVKQVKKVKGFAVHFGYFESFPSKAKVSVNSLGILEVDKERRLSIMRNHTALHLLNSALRASCQLSGEKSSAVTEDGLSLKFMFYKNTVDPEGFSEIEEKVRKIILHGAPVVRKILSRSQFHKLPDVVVIPGDFLLEEEIPVIEINSGLVLSREYCKGTHVVNTGHLKEFVITKVKKASYGVKDVEAVTGDVAVQIRKNDCEVQTRWKALESEINSCDCPSKAQDLWSKLQALSSEVNSSERLSFLVQHKLKSQIKSGSKRLNTWIKKEK